ncbi:hypothetical protein [Rubellicoccus peritrichatus]|uniref:Uncharacterized protein n=1 Tax=Rubellicoccus peritrichatus TaxID=3080537 RepID=A0AAQ3QTG4_9BACT|nr:hypothetical protein [Puniceicoccus sp. CR14]WOO39348.1 hypothetical protein RZN69_12050 [Puniceicoccus sp. CR14]
MYRFIQYILLNSIVLTGLVSAQVEISTQLPEVVDGKSLVRIEAKNTFDQPITGMRGWVVLMDAEGRVVGQRADWLIGGGKGADSKNLNAKSSPVTAELASEENLEIVMPIEHKGVAEKGKPVGEPVKAKVIVHRLIMKDGSMPDPRKYVVEPEKK